MPMHCPPKFNTSLIYTLGQVDEDGPRDLYKASSYITTSPFLSIAFGMRLYIAAKLLCSF